MEKKSELAKNTIILAIGKICTQFISFLLLPLYTALLSTEEYGAVDLFNTYCTLLLPIFNWQFDNGLFRFLLNCRDDVKRQKNIFTTVINTNVLQSVLYLAFYVVAQNYISSSYKIYLAVDVVLNIFLSSLLQFSRGIGNTTKYTVASFISASTMVGINVLLLVFFHLGADGMFIATMASKLITIVYLAISLRAVSYYIPHHFDKRLFKKILHYSFPLIPNQLSWWVIGVSDRTIISYVMSVAASGIYSVANKFSGLLLTFYNIFNLSWTESVSLHLKDEDSVEFLGDIINSTFSVFACACFGLISVFPFVFYIMVNKQYSEAYQQIPILMVAVLFQVITGLYSVIYVALKKSKDIAKTSFYAAIINLVINAVLIKRLGLYAASLSTFAAYATMGIYRYFHVKRYINVPLRKKYIVGTVIIGCISIVGYYSERVVIQLIVLLLVCTYSLITNWSLVKYMLELIKKKLRKR